MRHPGTSQPRLSVAMIVRNVEESIHATLESVAAIADEIVAVDTGSSDRTLEILRHHGAKVVCVPWQDSFASARNECLLHVRGDWVLWLDAGERFTGDAPQQLLDFVRERADSSRAYLMLVKVPRSQGHIAGEQVARVRLVANRSGIEYRGRVRESLMESLERLGITLEGLPWRIHRASTEHDPDRKQQKAHRDLQLAELDMSETGPAPRLLNGKGDALQVVQDAEGAAECFAASIELAEPGSPDMLEAYYGLLTALDATDTTREKQLSLCLQALEIYPVDAQLLCAMGGYLQSQGRLDLACRAYQTAYQHGQVDPRTWHLDEIHEIAAVCYSLSLQLQNNDELALKSLEEALDAHPGSERIQRQLVELHIKHSRTEKALKTVDVLPLSEAQRESLRSAVQGACLATQRSLSAAKAYLQAAFHAGCRDPICLRWYASTLLSIGDYPSLKKVLAEWQTIDPTNPEIQQFSDRIPDHVELPRQTHAEGSRPLRIDPQQPSPPPSEQPSRLNGLRGPTSSEVSSPHAPA